jgi:hypothetical protein
MYKKGVTIFVAIVRLSLLFVACGGSLSIVWRSLIPVHFGLIPG